jgi:hypothetical protein
MIATLVLAASGALQAPPTVGDTVVVTTTAVVAPGLIVRPQPWDLGELGTVLGPPEVEFDGAVARIRYALALWYPGEHDLVIPGPLLVSPLGRTDTLGSRRVSLRVASVLPSGADRESLDPRPPAGPVAQASRSLVPSAVFVLVTLGLGGLAVGVRRWRGRRRRGAVADPRPAPPPPDGTIETWARLGELRAAVDAWAHLIERHLAARPASAAGGRAAAWLEAAEEAGFRDEVAAEELRRLAVGARACLTGDGKAA